MDLGVSSSRGGRASNTASNLSMYKTQPHGEVTLHDFEVHALSRLKVLKGIELARTRGLKSHDLKEKVQELCRKHLGGSLTTAEDRRIDAVSHHILRLAYCQSEEKRAWFLQQELALFRHRLEHQTPEQVSSFMAANGVHFEPVADARKRELRDKLRAVFVASLSPGTPEQEKERQFRAAKFYQVPFQLALELVGTRRVFLRGGLAFVPRSQLVSIIVTQFRTSLAEGLARAARALPGVLQDERLGPVLTNMSKAYLGAQYGGNGKVAGQRVSPGDIDGLSASSFPLCMRNLHTALRRDHHLKHGGRMQYGLFLKGIGLSLEDALVFWQTEFSQKMSPEKFLKEYAYNIRHNYGKEGKRTDYTPYSCTKIITGSAPGTGEYHGCPYRHWDESHLRQALAGLRLAAPAVEDIVGLTRRKHFQVACRREFEYRMGTDAEAAGDHPNAYFNECQEDIKRRSGSAKDDSEGGEADGAAAPTPAAAAGAGAGGELPSAAAGAEG